MVYPLSLTIDRDWYKKVPIKTITLIYKLNFDELRGGTGETIRVFCGCFFGGILKGKIILLVIQKRTKGVQVTIFKFWTVGGRAVKWTQPTVPYKVRMSYLTQTFF